MVVMLESLFHYVHAMLILCISLGARASTDVSAPFIGDSRVGGGEGMIVIFFIVCEVRGGIFRTEGHQDREFSFRPAILSLL